ncbi:Guanylate cyclase [Seminavis robusta]|uniref:Guanylate cyclase n=1 Tax=Seminavis robusta TaxID=568900 RepID=A0A9N8E9X7_9STRA|nr:Guanylate cyclase [Seminavis robusta]|eukprot:Sro861_g212290.1 Guanylate cyclase (608) ;mRNA; r:28486-30309
MGVYAGIDYDQHDKILYGDIAIPIDDLPFHTGSDDSVVREFYIWSDYSWDSTIAGSVVNFDYEGAGDGPLKTMELASMGIGAMPNCKFGFVNLYTESMLADTANLDRNSPGNGAFTPYHERTGYAEENIMAGSELFEDYGTSYFDGRESLKHLPHQADYENADEILESLGELRDALAQIPRNKRLAIFQDIYDIVKGAWGDNSRILQALPNPPDNLQDFQDIESGSYGTAGFFDTIIQKGSKYLEKKQSVRDLDWLKEHGVCMDGIKSGTSGIPHAGRGAFATRSFRKGDVIAPMPLIHMPQRDVLTMYAQKTRGNDDDAVEDKDWDESYPPRVRDPSNPVALQLFLNYCFGHPNSTMLLSPYGAITSLINHGSVKSGAANAHLTWADNWQGHPEWLDYTPEELLEYPHAGLGFNVIALRDIAPDEEILMDYGPDWESAWEEHVQNWHALETKPTGTSVPYTPAAKLNQDIEQSLVDALELGYEYMGRGVTLYCYHPRPLFPPSSDNDDDDTDEEEEGSADALHECRPVEVSDGRNGSKLVFVAELIEWVENDDDWEMVVHETLFAAPSSIFEFHDLPFTTAFQMPWSFRHEIGIPDSLLPTAWLNQ